MSQDRLTNDQSGPPGDAPSAAIGVGAPVDLGSDTVSSAKAAVIDDGAVMDEAAREELVAEATDEFLDRERCGEHPDVEEFARRFRAIAGVLRGLLPALRSAQRSGSSAVHAAAGGSQNLGPQQSAAAPAGGQTGQLGQLGEFRLNREVGRGGMGVVYEAEQISLGRRVALKVLPLAAALDPRQLQRFRLEAQAAAHLHHSHIVPIYSVGCERGAYYYAMQFIEGRSLADVIADLEKQQPSRTGRAARQRISAESPTISEHRSAQRLSDVAPLSAGNVPPTEGNESAPPAEEQVAGRQEPPAASHVAGRQEPPATDVWRLAETAVRPAASATLQSIQSLAFFRTIAGLGVQAAEALDYAHGMGVIHRDIKPANLMLDSQGQIYIADFGLAQLQGDSRLTRTGDLVGTLRYMSPEQTTARHGVVDHRADIYSLGATLYELLTLAPAFDAPDRGALLRQIADEEPPAPRQRNRSIPVDLETIVLKAMAKEPHRRYATARELADDLGRFLEHRPITARRPTIAERASKWVRRHRSIVSTAALLLLLAGALVARAYVQLSQALRAETKALAQAVQERNRAEKAFAAEKQARDQAEQGRSRVEKAFERTRDALDFFADASDALFANEAGSAMAQSPELQELRRTLLAAALDYYSDFSELIDGDPSLQSQFEASQTKAGKLMAEIGTPEQQEAALEQVRQIQQKMLTGQPKSPIWQSGLASLYQRLSFLRGGRELGILSNPLVQAHLAFTPEQINRVKQMADERGPSGGGFGRHRERTPAEAGDEPQMLSADQWEARFDRLEKQQQELSSLLSPAQRVRLDQIMLQAGLLHRGPQALLDNDLAKRLSLNSDQREKIAGLAEDWWDTLDERRGTRESRDFGPRGFDRQANLDLWRQFQDQILGLFSEEQKNHWQELVGLPFDEAALLHPHGGQPFWGGHGGHMHRHPRSHDLSPGQAAPNTPATSVGPSIDRSSP